MAMTEETSSMRSILERERSGSPAGRAAELKMLYDWQAWA
jgi:hypothetical protein